MPKQFITIPFTILFLLVFTAVLLLIFPAVVVASFFGPIKGGNAIYTFCRFWAKVVLFTVGIKVRLINPQNLHPNKQYVFVFNHIAYIDIPVLLKAIPKNPMRVLAKHELGKIPIFGFLYKRAAVTVSRANDESRKESVQKLIQYIKHGISIVVAPEGTFNKTNQPLKEFYNGAFKVAIETQTPILPMVFLDCYDRNNYQQIFSITPGQARVLYLPEIKVAGLTNADVPALKAKVYQAMEACLIQHNASWIKK
jgi:1-acyl-sn-glycerol-3-phosphate acyltransferase